ncbi:MAG: TIGR02206 family membrane protein [Prosthecobacter sp.]|uniref:YwaF family protein n=1 Tax=Prosthecobacter sp. TaxID=1965333 RepID=UPI0025F8BDA7|nr:TIGR02206 family membrane protein [Prosthecobacter sp.]MCF7786139.1 TIGR02206 family membrane protein [Prosthecobacter sp.]
MPPAFHPYGPSHKAVLAITLALFIVMLLLSRTRWAKLSQRVLGTTLLALYPVGMVVHAWYGSLTVLTALPLQFCDIATLAGGIALWTRRPFFCEVVYFFGIAGTLQGLLTPALVYEFPDPRFILFFIMHGGVPITAFYVVTAMGVSPRPGAVLRILTFSVAWYAVIAVVNYALGANYAFQCSKPVQASLFDQLGPWPWYNFSTIGLGLVFYTLLYLPFAFLKARD